MPNTRFKEVCLEKKLTARVIEEKTGIKMRTVYSYLDGTRTPSSTKRKILRDKLGIDTAKIFD